MQRKIMNPRDENQNCISALKGNNVMKLYHFNENSLTKSKFNVLIKSYIEMNIRYIHENSPL